MALITNNISGSAAGNSLIGITGSLIIGKAAVLPGMPGADVTFFVSGSRTGKADGNGVSVFGGDAVVSGSLTIGTGSVTITSNEIKFLGGATKIYSGSGGLTFEDSSGPKTLASLSSGGGGGDAGAQYLVLSATGSLSDERVFTPSSGITYVDGGAGGNYSVSIDNTVVATVTGTIFTGPVSGTTLYMSGEITGSNALVTGDLAVNGGDFTSTAGTFNLLNGVTTLNVGSSATSVKIGGTGTTTSIFGNLYVSGTVVSVDSTNLKVSDPIVLLASGSTGPSAKSAIAFASGSTVSASSLIFGAGVGSDVLAAARQDVQDGNLTQASLSFTDLVPVRASSFQVGGGTAVVTSSDGLVLTVGGTSTTTLSGSTVVLNTNAATNFQRNGARVAQLIGVDGTEFKVAAMSTLGVATNLILTGSGIDLGMNSQGLNLKFADTSRGTVTYGASNLTLGTTAGVGLSLSASNGFTLTHGSSGAQFIKDFGTSAYLVIEKDGANDAKLRTGTSGDLILQSTGEDVKFNNATVTALTMNMAAGNAILAGGTDKTVVVGAVGAAGVMNVSGSTVGINFGTGGLKLYRDWSDALIINANGALTTISGSAGQNVRLAAGTGTTTVSLSGSNVSLVGSSVNLYQDSTLIAYAGTISATKGFFPNEDSTFNLGDSTRRWANIYTGDLHLKNDRGDYTLIEEEDFLSIRFNKTGKRYKFLLEPVPELDEK